MKRLLLIVQAFLICMVSHSQEEIYKFENRLKIGDNNINRIYTLSDDENEKVFLFPDGQKIAAYLYDANFEAIGQGLLLDNFLFKYPHISGFVGKDRKRTIFLRKDTNKKWGAVFLDFDKRSIRQEALGFKLKDVHFINEFTRNGFHYILTILKRSSTFRLYRLDDAGKLTHNDYNLETTNFSPEKRSSIELSEILRPQSDRFGSNVIEGGTPLALNAVNEVVKLYPQEGHVRLTIDMKRTYSFVIEIPLDETLAKVHTIKRPSLLDPSSLEKTNSFLKGDHLFSFKASPDELLFAIIDIESNDVLKEYRVNRKEDILFANTPIIQEGGALSDYRELDRTKQFLRKTANSNPAITVFENNGDYIITLGASQEMITSPQIMVMTSTLGGAIGAGIFMGIANTTFSNYLNYSRVKTARIQSVLGKNYEHKPEAEVPENVFDRIEAFETQLEEELEKDKGGTTLFKQGNDFIWGVYHHSNNMIHFYSFKN